MDTSICTLDDLYRMSPEPLVDPFTDERFDYGWTWLDPRRHPTHALDGPLGRTIRVRTVNDLRDACEYAMTHTFLDSGPMDQAEPTWIHDDVWLVAQPRGSRVVEVRSRLLAPGGPDSERVIAEFWADSRFTVGADALGTYVTSDLSADPLVLRDLAALMLDAFDATSDFYRQLADAGVSFTAANRVVDFMYHFCGTSLVIHTSKYGNKDEHPLLHRDDEDELDDEDEDDE